MMEANHANRKICLRVCIAAVEGNRILLVPHFFPESGSIQWVLPGGQVQWGEELETAAQREFQEETGLQAQITGMLDASQVILPEKPWHSVTIAFLGRVTGGKLKAEAQHEYGEKMPRWFSLDEIGELWVHPKSAITKAFHTLSDKMKVG